MTSLIGKYAEAKTCVFWDTEDCPIPKGLNPESVYRNIRRALANKGYHGEVTIWAYGDKNQIPGYFESAGIKLDRAGVQEIKVERVERMRIGIFGWVLQNKSEALNLFVVSGNNMHFSMVLEACKEGKPGSCNILLAEPVNIPRRCCRTALDKLINEQEGAEWLWETLAAAGDPITTTTA
ncbi:hypothetical protein EUTSA_v10006264mg [Eutrema salsugineum]|uniref:NYN domain-containing protein n=1 Tax=Eutrema salsugineum TaxID=72664 RepID=V4L130_EUTSA|nr:uncharacterized protein LOC18019754 [Eutrema salsugineum]ESQ43975.1 hypothetical protein EUTSA_v10006264mg [Eutrema salsugineum]